MRGEDVDVSPRLPDGKQLLGRFVPYSDLAAHVSFFKSLKIFIRLICQGRGGESSPAVPAISVKYLWQ